MEPKEDDIVDIPKDRIRYFGGAEDQAERLRKEGFALDRKGKVPKVRNFRESLVRLD